MLSKNLALVASLARQLERREPGEEGFLLPPTSGAAVLRPGAGGQLVLEYLVRDMGRPGGAPSLVRPKLNPLFRSITLNVHSSSWKNSDFAVGL